MIKRNDGFTLIELMVVMVIMMVILGASGWNYIRLRDRNAVEAAARTLRNTLSQARNYAKIGQWAINENDFCYPGDLTDPNPPPTSAGGSGVEQEGLAGFGLTVSSFTVGYAHDLQIVAQKGLVLENYGVFWDKEPNKLEIRILCKRRASTASAAEGTWPGYGANKVKPYHYAYDVVKTDFFPLGVSVLKPSAEQFSNGVYNMAGVEFTPLYLMVRSPISGNRVNFGTSCFGEEDDEIVVGDTDMKYLYKLPVGSAGDVGEGCFCERGLSETEIASLTGGCITSVDTPTLMSVGPCSNICRNDQ
ncbi:prepilin-type N-terminal cleavage/methylation domain-containing protein [Microgenomates group bacterium]|nr:prepilin-type N-terminal cleavage/methylation domain-containing protein [Microgenomates group bacterium]